MEDEEDATFARELGLDDRLADLLDMAGVEVEQEDFFKRSQPVVGSYLG